MFQVCFVVVGDERGNLVALRLPLGEGCPLEVLGREIRVQLDVVFKRDWHIAFALPFVDLVQKPVSNSERDFGVFQLDLAMTVFGVRRSSEEFEPILLLDPVLRRID
jgi:hypothetical protein